MKQSTFEITKIVGAVLSVVLVVLGARELAHVIYNQPDPDKPGYIVEVIEVATNSGAGVTGSAGTATSSATAGAGSATGDAKVTGSAGTATGSATAGAGSATGGAKVTGSAGTAAGSTTGGAAVTGGGGDVSLASLLSKGSVAAGKKKARKCQSCHSLKKGGRTVTGPPMWDIIGRQIASLKGFKYSRGMTEKGQTGMVWNYDNMNAFLEKPKSWVPKTKMTFRGFKKAVDRANVILYLYSLSDAPKPLPNASGNGG